MQGFAEKIIAYANFLCKPSGLALKGGGPIDWPDQRPIQVSAHPRQRSLQTAQMQKCQRHNDAGEKIGQIEIVIMLF